MAKIKKIPNRENESVKKIYSEIDIDNTKNIFIMTIDKDGFLEFNYSYMEMASLIGYLESVKAEILDDFRGIE
jgi:hypothetical protein